MEIPTFFHLPVVDSNGNPLSYRGDDVVRVVSKGMLCVVFYALRKVAMNDLLTPEEKVEMIRESELYQNLDQREWLYLERICEPLDEEWEQVRGLLQIITASVKKDWRFVSAFEALGIIILAEDKEDILADPCLPKEAVGFLAKLYLELIKVNDSESEVSKEDLEVLKTLAK